MSGVQLPDAYLINTDLSDVWIPHADLTNATLTGAKLIGVKGLTPEQRQMVTVEGALLDEPEASAGPAGRTAIRPLAGPSLAGLGVVAGVLHLAFSPADSNRHG